MRIRIETEIYGIPPRLNLSAKILYGKDNQHEKKVFRKAFSLDKGGKVELPLNFFIDYADTHIAPEYHIKEE